MHNSTSNVRELLAATLLSDARLLAGAGGLQRPVQRVQWVEVLDDKADHFAPGDLLLTTAYNLRDDGALQHELAAQMLEFGVSAVVIKCGYYLDRVPAPVLAAADRLDLPILELDRSVAFVEVAQSIYAHLTARSTARMRRSAAVHRDLVQLVVDGGGLDQLVARAARLLDMPLAVTGEAGELLAAAPTPHRPAADAAAFPVVVRGLRRGAVWAAPGSGGDELVEQVAGVVALVAAGDDRRRRERSRLYAELVLDLVAGGEPAELLLRSRRLGVDVPEVAYVIAVETETAEAAPAARAALAERLPSGSLVVAAGSRLVAVVSEEGHQAATAEPDWLGTASVSAGISGPAAGVGELPFHHRRAVRAAALGRSLHGPGRVWRFDDVEVYDALLGDGDPERLDRIRARVLGPLGPDLRTTLRVVSECGAGPAAGRLFVHRNTVRYRLRRIESLTGLRLDRAEDRLLCELALLYDRMTAGPAAAVTDPGGI